MMPRTDPKTGYLPPGVHDAAWEEVERRFGGSAHRVRLMAGLLAACRHLAGAGCGGLPLDGSFVTTKIMPGDYDGAWETAGVDFRILDPVFLTSYAAVKEKYLGDLFPASGLAEPGTLFRDFFQTDRDGIEKGMVPIDLGSLP